MSTLVNPISNWSITGVPPASSPNAPQKVLFFGLQGAGSTATAEVLVTNIGNDGEEDELFGEQSMLAYMIRQFKRINTTVRLDAIPFDDAGGATFASASIDIAGTATETGQITVSIQSRQLYTFTINVAIGDGADEIGAAIVTAVTDAIGILVDASYLNPTVTFDSLISGTEGNFITIEIKPRTIPAGISFTITPFAGGATNPLITSTILNQITNIRYQTYVAPGSWTQTNLLTYINSRAFDVDTAKIADGVVFLGQTDSQANVIANAAALDSKSYTLLANRPVSVANQYEGSSLFESDFAIASQFAAIRSLRLTDNQNIAGFLVGGSNSGNFLGGARVSAIPYQNTPFQYLATIESEYGWTTDEQLDLNNNGVSFLGNNTDITSIISGQIVTTYLDSDKQWKYLNVVDTASTIREFFYNSNKNNFPQSVLTIGSNLVPNSNQVNVTSYRAYQKQLYSILANDPDYALTPTGQTAVDYFMSNLQVSSDLATGKITEFAIVPINTQIREIVGSIQISFTI